MSQIRACDPPMPDTGEKRTVTDGVKLTRDVNLPRGGQRVPDKELIAHDKPRSHKKKANSVPSAGPAVRTEFQSQFIGPPMQAMMRPKPVAGPMPIKAG